MSTNNRVGRNPFEKSGKSSKAVSAEKSVTAEKPAVPTVMTKKSALAESTMAAAKSEKPSASDKSKKVLKTSYKKAKQDSQLAFSIQEVAPTIEIQEEQIIGELIELPEESWQPLTATPAGFIKQLFARWL